VVSEDIESFEYTPKPEFSGPFTVFNELDELALLRKFCNHVRELKPHVCVTYNGDNFDWPYVAKRCELNGLDLKAEVGFSAADSGGSSRFLSTCARDRGSLRISAALDS